MRWMLSVYLTDMGITATFTLKVFTTDRASNMLGASDLVDEKSFLIGEVLVATLAVIMIREPPFMLLHLLGGLEAVAAPAEGTGHTGFGGQV